MRRNNDGTVDTRRIDLSNNSPEAIQKNDVYVEEFDIIYVPRPLSPMQIPFWIRRFLG
jgi:hypothetical protein